MPKQSNPSGKTRPGMERRSDVLSAVKTPLGFFALVVLAVEGILAFAVSVTDGFDRSLLVAGMIGLIAFLVLIVAALATWRPDALYGKSPSVSISVNKKSGQLGDGKVEAEEGAAIITVRRPKFLIAGAEGDFWGSLVESDRAVIASAFPKGSIKTHFDATASSLSQELLQRGACDVLQLSCNIGSQGNLDLGDPDLTAKGLSRLIEQSGVKLLVLATCNSATLAAEVAPYSNMVAATGNLTVEGWLEWSSIFYPLLANGVPLTRAYSIAQEVVDLPVIMILHRETKIIQ